MEKLRVLVGCEESQVVTKAFRANGHEAYSCDLQECSGGHPEWHIQGSILDCLEDGWDLLIAHPPCTHLSVSGARHFEEKRKDGRQQKAIDFFMRLTDVNIRKTVIENPIGIMSTIYRKPDQIIQPYYFGDEAQKTTCLWFKNIHPLFHSKEKDLFNKEVTHVSNGGEVQHKTSHRKMNKFHYETSLLPQHMRSAARSKTFPGIAKAMADQWG